jgi:hypothetical protein
MQINLENELVLIGGRQDLAAQLAIAPAPAFVASHPSERLLVHYSSGEGTVRPDGKGFNIRVPFLNADGSRAGDVTFNWETYYTKDQIESVFPNPAVDLDETGPIGEVPLLTRVQAHWVFNNGSTLTAIGGGVSEVSQVTGSPNLLAKDAAALQVTAGTGDWAGVRGLVSVNASVLSPAGQSFFGNPGAVATLNTTQSFRLAPGTVPA